MTFKEIAAELGYTPERVRQIFVRACQKLSRRAPALLEALAASERIHDRRSIAQSMIDIAPFVRGESGGHR